MRMPTAIFLLCLGVYAYFYQAGGWNQNSRFDLVRAIAEHGTVRIDRYAANTGDDAIRDGHHYCDKAPGASVLCLPSYVVMYRLAGAPDAVTPQWLAWAAWLSIVVAIGVPSACAAAFLSQLGLRLGLAPRAGAAVALLWALGTMAFPYSTLLYGNQLAASLLVIAFALMVDVRLGAPPAPRRMIVVGALLGSAVATEYPAALIGVPIAIYALAAAGVRPSLYAAVGGLVPIALLLAYHAAAFGSPFAFPYDYSVWETPHTGWFMGIRAPDPYALTHILVGQYRGLFYAAPWLLAAVPGTVWLARRHRRETMVCASAVLLFVWLNASIPPWHGGWAAGPRYLVPMLPFMSLLAGGIFLSARARVEVAAAVLALGLFSMANMFAATAVKPEMPTSELKPYTDVIWPNFVAGRIAISRQSIDAIDNPSRGVRQAWNLGMKAGLDGQLSLLPLYVFMAAMFGWLAVLLGREERGNLVAGRQGFEPR